MLIKKYEHKLALFNEFMEKIKDKDFGKLHLRKNKDYYSIIKNKYDNIFLNRIITIIEYDFPEVREYVANNSSKPENKFNTIVKNGLCFRIRFGNRTLTDPIILNISSLLAQLYGRIEIADNGELGDIDDYILEVKADAISGYLEYWNKWKKYV